MNRCHFKPQTEMGNAVLIARKARVFNAGFISSIYRLFFKEWLIYWASPDSPLRPHSSLLHTCDVCECIRSRMHHVKTIQNILGLYGLIGLSLYLSHSVDFLG